MKKIGKRFLACLIAVSIISLCIPDYAKVIQVKAEGVESGTISKNLIGEYSSSGKQMPDIGGLALEEASGKCGDNLYWVMYDDGTLNITGTGSMPDYTTVNNYYTGLTTDVPWGDYLNDIIQVEIEENVANIGKCAFADCPSIERVSLPVSIEKIGESAFARCVGLDNIVFPNKLKSIGANAFRGCTGITSIEVPDSVEDIGESAFQACSNLDTASLSKSLSYIPSYMFSSCSKLANIEIPQSVTRIGIYAFALCSSLSEIDIPASVNTISDRVFESCSLLRKVTVNNDSLSYSYSQKIFENCSGELVLYGNSGSTTETYAKENGHIFVSTGVANPSNPTIVPGKVTYYGVEQKEKSEKELVKEAANEFVKAENEYIGAMNSAIRLGVNSTKEVEKIREKDRASEQPILTLVADTPDTAINAAYAGVAEFFREYRETTPSIGEIDISGSMVSIEAKIIKVIKSSIKSVNVHTKYGNYTIKISGILKCGAFFCDINVSGNGHTYSGTIISTADETKKVMAAYIKSLGEAGEDVSKQALKAYLKDFARYACISDFTSEKMNDALADVADYLQSKGWGKKVLEYGVKLYDGYDLVDSIVKAENETGLSNSLSNAENIYNKVKTMSYTDSSVKDKTIKITTQKIENARKNFEDALWNYIYHSKSESGTLSFWDKVKGTYKKIIGHCPVDFSVYDEEGKVLGIAEDGYCEYDDSIYMEVSGDVKIIYVPNDMKIRIEMTGTDRGAMSYVLEQYQDNVPSGRKNYYDIPLEEGGTYSQVISSGAISSSLSDDSLNAGDGSIIKPNEYISADDSAQIDLSCVVSGQGSVTGTGMYVKGDAVEFAAYPDDGYYFDGWYDGERLVGVEAIYRLAALENKELKAVFQKVDKAEQKIDCENSYSVLVGDEDFAINASGMGGDLHYFSSDENVADVDEIGNVSIVGPGTAQIMILASETEDYKEAMKQVDVTVLEKGNSDKKENTKSSFEIKDYSNLVKNHIPEVEGKCKTSFLGKRPNGEYQAAVYNEGKIYVKNFSSNYKVESSKVIDLELPLWGSIFLGKSYNYVICGKAYDKELDDGGEVYRIIKYSKDFERIDSISLSSEETYTALPFDGGNVSVDESGNLLTVYTSRLRYDAHQSNIAIRINTLDMTVSNKYGMISFPDIHVSHSFRQIVKYDGTEPVYVDVSDGSPQRSVFLQSKNAKKALINIAGEYGFNVTNTELSGLAVSDTNYLVVGSYVNQESNNIFLSSVDKESGEVENQWLTDSSAFMQKYFHNPRIVKITKNKFLVMWGSYTTQYILVDGKGNIISELKESPAPITDCEPIYANGKVLCLSVESGTMEFYEITDFSSNGIYKPEIKPLKSGVSWDGASDISWYDSKKTEFDISTAQQLAGLAQMVNSGNTFEGKKINLCRDIFLNDSSYEHVWTPIAAYVRDDDANINVFQGTFSGNGHVIYNMKTDDGNDGGLFGRIGEKGMVKCVDISQGLLSSGGCIANVNEGIISFCNNYSCTGAKNLYAVGGICNFNAQLVYGCKNYGEVWGSTVAGIVGQNIIPGATVSQCSNHGLAGGSGEAAGIVYFNRGWVSNCYNKGIVADGYLGNINRARCLCGIVYKNCRIVENCYSAGVFSYEEDGPWLGIYGGCRESDEDYTVEIRNCYTLFVGGLEKEGMEEISYEELQTPSFAARLDQQKYSILPVWREDVNKINDGLPITAADESSSAGKCKIQPEVWSLEGGTVIDAKLEDKEYSFGITSYFNESAPTVTVENTDVAEATVRIAEDKSTEIAGVSVSVRIQLKKAGTTQIKVHFNETENSSSADYKLTLKIKNSVHKHDYAKSVSPASVKRNGSVTKTCTECGKKTTAVIYKPNTIKLSKTRLTFNNKNQKPSVIVIDSKGKTLSSKTDYTVSYPKTMKKVGQYTVTIKFKGNYCGTVKKKFTIVPKGTSISKITSKKKGIILKWKKQTAQTTGYEIAYSTDSKFSKKNTKIVPVGKNKTTSKSVSKLKDKKKYYVRIRTYKKIGGRKYYSDWSKVRNVNTK